MKMATSVDEVLVKRFLDRPLREKIGIFRQGSPRPVLCNVETEGIVFAEGTPVNKFCNQFKWLTCSETKGDVYCWPCLLFPCDGIETTTFISDSKDGQLYSNILKHTRSPAHKNGLLQYILFANQHSLTIEEPIEFTEESWRVKRNRDLVKRLIDVCLMVLPLSPPLEVSSAFNVEHLVRILTLMKKYDGCVAEEALNFATMNPAIMRDIIAAVALHMKEAIKLELQSSSSAALILSEHSAGGNKSKFSTVVRYVCNSSVCERFIGFTNLNIANNVNLITKHILRLISELEIHQKFVALSLGGAVLPTGALSNFVTSFQKQYPSYYFVPCHFHDFNYVLEQSLSEIPECRQFFKILGVMKAFFQNNINMGFALNDFTKGKISYLSQLKMTNSQFLRVLKVYRRQLNNFFIHVEQHHDLWSADNVVKATGFQSVLGEYKTLFLLEAFYMLFSHIAILSDMLNSSSPESVFDKSVLENIKAVLRKDRNNGFERLWTLVINAILKDSKPEMLQSAGEEETKELLELYKKIVDCFIEEIEIRFCCAGRLAFLSTLSSETNSRLIVSDQEMMKLTELQNVEKESLKKELKLLCKNGAVFRGKSVHELMDILITAGLDKTCKNVHQVAELILTMPCKPCSPHENTAGASKLDLINTWATIPHVTDEMNYLSHLCIEKDFLRYLNSRTEFYDQVNLKLKDVKVLSSSS